jgi:hypothetical protein
MLEIIQSEWPVGITLLIFPTIIWLIALWERYFPDDDKRFPRKRNEQLHKWFEEQRRKTFKP